MTPSEWVLWASVSAVVYAYLGYPLLVAWLASRRPATAEVHVSDEELPHVTMLIPVFNERATIEAKLANTLAIDYPAEKFSALFISDGSTDGTIDVVRGMAGPRIRALELPERQGKATALNTGLRESRSPIVVFSDASIMLEPGALRAIVAPFASPDIGCVSGEDRIAGGGGEGLYGRYEMFLRRQESRLHSIVGASGSFYAQRRELCGDFVPFVAPDFLSVLRTVEQGFRAISEPSAVGWMSAVENASDEFHRKVRTILRGLTTLVAYRHLLNPFRHGVFAFELLSHKLARWLVPFFLALVLVLSAVNADRTLYRVLFVLQVAFYAAVAVGPREWLPTAARTPIRVGAYFTGVNLATLVAWWKFLSGTRQETWAPSRRS